MHLQEVLEDIGHADVERQVHVRRLRDVGPRQREARSADVERRVVARKRRARRHRGVQHGVVTRPARDVDRRARVPGDDVVQPDLAVARRRREAQGDGDAVADRERRVLELDAEEAELAAAVEVPLHLDVRERERGAAGRVDVQAGRVDADDEMDVEVDARVEVARELDVAAELVEREVERQLAGERLREVDDEVRLRRRARVGDAAARAEEDPELRDERRRVRDRPVVDLVEERRAVGEGEEPRDPVRLRRGAGRRRDSAVAARVGIADRRRGRGKLRCEHLPEPVAEHREARRRCLGDPDPAHDDVGEPLPEAGVREAVRVRNGVAAREVGERHQSRPPRCRPA